MEFMASAKETVSAIMMLYKNTKEMGRTSDGDADFFDVVTGVSLRDKFAPYMFLVWLDY